MNRTEIEVHVEILSRCILECLHCSSDARSETKRPDLPIANFVDYIRRMCLMANVHLFLTGGEPLLFRNLPAVISELGKLPGILYMGLFSTACLADDFGKLKPVSPEKACELRQKELSVCYLSIYSHDQRTHENVTGVPGSFHCTWDSIRSLVEAGIEARVHCPVMKVNYASLSETALYCAKEGIKEIRFLRLVKHGRAKKNWMQIGLEQEQQRAAIVKTVNELRAVRSNIRVTVAGFPDLFDCRPFNIGPMCQAGIGLFYINWKGDVFPCACRKRDPKFILGNIFDGPVYPDIRACFSPCRSQCLQDI